jgi:hypothetical protein
MTDGIRLLGCDEILDILVSLASAGQNRCSEYGAALGDAARALTGRPLLKCELPDWAVEGASRHIQEQAEAGRA